MREITIWSTRGGDKAKITTDVTTWGELKPLIPNNYNLEELTARESINNTDLNTSLAVLPTGAFVIFLAPKKVKSGIKFNIDTANHGELKAEFKKLAAKKKNGREFKSFINSKVNWTRQKSSVLRTNMKDWLYKESTLTNTNNEIIVEEVPSSNSIIEDEISLIIKKLLYLDISSFATLGELNFLEGITSLEKSLINKNIEVSKSEEKLDEEENESLRQQAIDAGL